MPNFTNLTHAQLIAATKTQIITAVGNYLTALDKKRIIELLMDATEFTDTPTVTHGKHGILTQTQTVRDALGAVIREEKYNAKLV